MRQILAIVLFISGLFFFWPHSDPSHEERIRDSIQDAAEATRRGLAGDFMDEIAMEFTDPSFSRKSLHGMLLREFLGSGGSAVHLGDISVHLAPSQTNATATVTAEFPGSFFEARLESATVEFHLDYTLEDDEWRIRAQQNQPTHR